ncbi:MAG: hypothetical protein AB1425_01105 [Actinomycetota bacterium]
MLEEYGGSGAARRIRTVVLAALLVALALVLSGCGGTESEGGAGEAASEPTKKAGSEQGEAAAKPSPATQTSEGGEVTVEVTWKGESAGPVFDVTMDTHSVNLDSYDLRKQAVLRNDRGQEVRARAWDAPKGGHHREGTLSFPEKTADGEDLIGPDTRKIELVIRDVAGVPERSFEWSL